MATKTGRGSIVQLEKKDQPRSKCRKWRLVISLGKDPQTGKYPQKSKVFHGTFKEAQKALREFDDEITHGRIVKKSSWTFNEYMEVYLKDREDSGELTQKTLRSTRNSLRGLAYLIGHVRLQDVTAAALKKAYNDLRNGNSRSGRKLRGTTVHEYHVASQTMFEHARKAGIIAVNPFIDAEAPSNDTREKSVLSGDSYTALINRLDPTDGNHIAVILCATLGLRRGEACGLSWGDIDFEAGTVFIHHSYDEFGNLKEPKTEAGVRILPLPDFTSQALVARRDFMLSEFNGGAMGYTVKRPDGSVELKPEVPVSTDKFGSRTNPQTLSSWWTNARKHFDAQGISLHQLRHTFLSLAAEQGVHPSVMQKLAGHASPNVTMKIYTHVNVEAKKAAMETLQAAYMMGGGEPKEQAAVSA